MIYNIAQSIKKDIAQEVENGKCFAICLNKTPELQKARATFIHCLVCQSVRKYT
jgi:hypothetical protein